MMKRLSYLFILPVLFVLSSCDRQEQKRAVTPVQDTPKPLLNQHLLQSVLWFETSGELAALYYQAYNLARLRFDEKLRHWKKLPAGKRKNKAAVIVDIDETILDNSPYEGFMLQKNMAYEDSSWTNWIESARAAALPGALDFLKYVKTKGAEVFYVSNRYEGRQKEATRRNLDQLGFPGTADTSFMIFRSAGSSKEARRQKISEQYDILLLCGDNLGDFSDIFDGREQGDKMDLVRRNHEVFGDRFIVLPNPMYGDWEKTLWNGRKLSDREKDSARYSRLKGR